MFRNSFILMLMFTLLFAFPLAAEDEDATPSKDGAESAETAEESKAEEDASKEDATKEKDEKKDEKKDEVADESKKEETEAKEDVKEEPKEEAPAEPKVEAEKAPAVEAELEADAKAAEKAVAEKKPAEEAPQVDLKSAVSTEEKAEEEEEKKEEKPKRFSVFVNNSFSNTQDFSRPVFRYGLSVGFGVRLPWKIGFKFSTGLYTSVAYKRPNSNSGSQGNAEYNVLLNPNLTTSSFDGIPLRFGLARPFQLPWKLTLTPVIASTLSVTSKFLWNMKIYSKLFLGLNLSRSFELKKNLSLSTRLGGMYNVTFNGEEWVGNGTTGIVPIGKNPQSLMYNANVGLNYKDFSFGIGWRQIFLYLREASWEDKDNLQPENDIVNRLHWSVINSFSMSLSYSIKGFNFGLSMDTTGPWTLNYTGPSWYPFRPDMTTYGLNVGYNYAF